MQIVETKIKEVLILEPKIFGDHRGWFLETYSKKLMADFGVHIEFIQDNHSMSNLKGTLRGLHFQNDPFAQTKLVRCTRGAILDVAVDIRLGSPCFKQWVAIELSEENKRQLFIPRGFAHGFVTLTDHAEVQYKVDAEYEPTSDRSIRYDDPEFSIIWGVGQPVLSEKDKNAPYLRDIDCNFVFNNTARGGNK